jgi:hypothetical protein
MIQLHFPPAVSRIMRQLWSLSGEGRVPVLVLTIFLGVQILAWLIAQAWYLFAAQGLPAFLRHFQTLSPEEQAQTLAQLESLSTPSFWGLLVYTAPIMLLVFVWRLPAVVAPSMPWVKRTFYHAHDAVGSTYRD